LWSLLKEEVVTCPSKAMRMGTFVIIGAGVLPTYSGC